ncbi:MAG: hypothetical protein IJE09_06255 [Oscillospiraceae bacterium]|nr:hypothetical protein [Oscillospiraceae bacterium]
MENQQLEKALNPGERLTWQQILADPEYRSCYDKAVQSIVQRRLRNRQGAEEQLMRLRPLLHAIALRYGVSEEPECMDCEKLAELIMQGVEKSLEDVQRVFEHLDCLHQQEAELKAQYPGFELGSALEDPGFLRLTAPHTGLSLIDAYYALHRDEMQEQAARESLEKLSRSILSGGRRPREICADHPAHSFSPDPRSMSRAQREQLKKRIYDAGALGEKIYP